MVLGSDDDLVVLIELGQLAVVREGGVEPLANLGDGVGVALGFFTDGIVGGTVGLGFGEAGDVVLHLGVGRQRLAGLRSGVGTVYNREALILKVGKHLVFIGVVDGSQIGESLGDGHGAAGEINLVSIHSNFLSDSLGLCVGW